ncbi:MAG TPA: AI-2E family transporter [Capsulimonadaceae bacterium]|nr:AI-2E family transporter [Capsulimonadaceae bacterium]
MEKWTRLLVVIAACLLMVAFVAVAVRLAMYIQHTLLLFALGGLLAYALEPLVSFLRYGPMFRWATNPETGRKGFVPISPDHESYRPGMPRWLAITIVFLGVFALLGLGGYGLEQPLARQIHLLSDKRIQDLYEARGQSFLSNIDTQLGHIGIHTNLALYLADPTQIPQNVRDKASDLAKEAIPLARDAAVFVGEIVFVLLIAIYWLVYGSELRVRLNRRLPESLLSHAVVWEEDVNRILGGFIRGQLLIALVMGFGAAMACLIVGIHFWLLIGLFVVFAALIPVFGPYLGAIPAVLLALIAPTHMGNNIVAAIVIICLFTLINELGSKVLYPRLVGQAIGLHELVVLFAIIAGLELDGVIGVLFAAPLTAVVMATVVHLYRFWQDLPDSLLSRPVTTERVANVRGQIEEAEEEPASSPSKPIVLSSAEPAPAHKQ